MGYVIRSVRDTGTITYHCGTTRGALEKVKDFRRAEYRNITVRTADDRRISQRQLARLNDTDGTGILVHPIF